MLQLSQTIKSRYATLVFDQPMYLATFNKKLKLSRGLRKLLPETSTLEQAVCAKVDLLVEKSEVVLGMFPDKLHVTVVLLPDADAVAATYKKRYGTVQRNIAFYSLSADTIFISVKHAKMRVLVHELGHYLVDLFFKERAPHQIHELIAQYVERHITD